MEFDEELFKKSYKIIYGITYFDEEKQKKEKWLVMNYLEQVNQKQANLIDKEVCVSKSDEQKYTIEHWDKRVEEMQRDAEIKAKMSDLHREIEKRKSDKQRLDDFTKAALTGILSNSINLDKSIDAWRKNEFLNGLDTHQLIAIVVTDLAKKTIAELDK